MSCQLINKSSNEILDDPNFWLRKWSLTDWRNAIQLSKNTKLESNITKYLRRIFKRNGFINVPCYIDKKAVELFLKTDFVINPSPSQFIDMILSGDKGIIQLAIILMKNPNPPPLGFQDSLESHENQSNDKTAIGEFLGEKEYQDLMHMFVNLMNFSNMDFLKALRYFLEGFRLPGESQKIDRLMEKFASRYCECNPRQDMFKNADTVYVLVRNKPL